MANRPNMKPYFRARIDYHVNGVLARTSLPRPPAGVVRIKGDVTDREITVVMNDGTEFRYEGGRYASRKVNGCYAPLMPKPVK